MRQPMKLYCTCRSEWMSETTPLVASNRELATDDAPAPPPAGSRLHRLVGVPVGMSLKGMTWQLTSNVVPAAGTMLLFYATQAITLMFVGRQLGVTPLAQYGLGQSILNAAGISLAQGMAAGLDTLCAQSYGRHKRGPECGEILQRGIVICVLLTLPLMALFLAAEPIVVAVFGGEVGGGVAVYLRCAPPLLLLITLFTCLQKALQAQQLPHLPLLGAAVGVALCPLLNLWLTHRGIEYAVLVMILCNAVSLAVTVAASLLHSGVMLYDATWPSRTVLDRKEIRAFLDIGVPSMLSVVCEWWSFELLMFVTASFGTTSVAAYNIAQLIITVLWTAAQGVMIAVCVLVGDALGERDAQAAKAFAKLGALLGAAQSLVILALFLAVNELVFRQFTDDAAVLALLRTLVPFIAAYLVLDAAQTVLQGAFRGVGRQAMAAKVVVVSLWLVGAPLSLVLAFEAGLALRGIVLGTVCGFAVEVPLLLWDMRRWDWVIFAAEAAAVVIDVGPPSSRGQFSLRGSQQQRESADAELAPVKSAGYSAV
jgi:MATE family multidrug resistance protein